MTRVKNGVTTKARHKKVLKAAKGYFGSKHRLYKTAKEQLMHSGQYAFRDRRQKKREFRKLWIVRINAACRENEISYSRFIEGLNKAGVEVNRKMLSEIAIADPKAFSELVKVAKAEGYGALAITDHDTATAYPELKAACEKEGIECIFGVEFSVQLPEWHHIVGFHFDPEYPPMKEYLAELSQDAHNKIKGCFDEAVELGDIKGITWEEITTELANR